ncbi:MAG: hypothetical protein NDF54_05155 [archaeon GB-1867-035]|nr:hypothetical protein [Candidatus Culexmicrobium profundum]
MRRISFLILIVAILAIQYISLVQAVSNATLKTWYYLGMKAELQDYLNLGPGDKVCQGFKPPRSWTVDKISLYAEYSAGVEGVEKEKNITIQSVSYIYVELREGGPDGTLLAYGTVYIGYLDWYDVQLSSQVTLSPDKWYYIVAYSPYDSWNIYYHYDGQPNNDGPAGINRFGYWESLSVDLLTRYHATYTIDSTRIQQLKTLAQTYKPSLRFETGMIYFPCDFYYDLDIDVDNNTDNYPSEEWKKLEKLRVFIHIEEYSFSDEDGIGPAIAIEYWFYYVYNIYYIGGSLTYEHPHDWELHLVVFVDQYDTSNVVLLKTGVHGGLYSRSWEDAIERSGTHVTVFIVHDSHAADIDRDIPKEGWDGDGVFISYDDSRYKEIYVWDSEPCEYEDTFNGEVYCRITNWEGAHVYWDTFSQYWWAKDYGSVSVAWHKDAWDEPGVTYY